MQDTEYHWTEFYQDLGILGPKMLTGVHAELAEYVVDAASGTDSFWSDGLEATLEEFWDKPEEAVKKTVELWHENVVDHMTHLFGPMSILPEMLIDNGMSRRQLGAQARSVGRIKLKLDESLLVQLTASAVWGLRANKNAAEIALNGIITPVRKVSEGMLIRALTIPWKAIVQRLDNNWQEAFAIPPHKWEEIIAAAFDEAGFQEVTLTPRSSDHGRDVIAVRYGVGTIRIINSVKAYKPGRLVRYDDVRALMGVLQADHQASKGILTTTSGFAPRIANDPFISPLIPYRLELMNGDQLRKWLLQLAATK